MLASVDEPDEILRLTFPENFPAKIFYDGLLKRQRRATVDVNDPKICFYLAEALSWINLAKCVFTENEYDIVILSHCLDFTYGSLAWMAIKNNILF